MARQVDGAGAAQRRPRDEIRDVDACRASGTARRSIAKASAAPRLSGAREDEVRAQGEGVESALPPADPNALWPEGEATLEAQPPANVDDAKLGGGARQGILRTRPGQAAKDARGRRRLSGPHHRGALRAGLHERHRADFAIDGQERAERAHRHSWSATRQALALCAGAGARMGRSEGSAPRDHARQSACAWRAGSSSTRTTRAPKSDTNMQYTTGDFAAFTAAKPLEAKPGDQVQLFDRHVEHHRAHRARGGGAELQRRFCLPATRAVRSDRHAHDDARSRCRGQSARRQLRLCDAHATMRASRLLFLRDGVWNGTRILPEGWVKYTLTPTPGALAKKGTARISGSTPGTDPKVQRWPNVPADAFIMSGIQGQNVISIPVARPDRRAARPDRIRQLGRLDPGRGRSEVASRRRQ